MKTVLRTLLGCWLALALLWPGSGWSAPQHATSGRIPTAPPHDPYVAALIQQVRAERLADYIAELSGERAIHVGGQNVTLATRYTYSGDPIAQATQYLYERMEALGYTVSYHPYRYNGYALRNVVAEKRGLLRPNEVYLLTAHVDDRAATWPHNPAPGADDNASGTAALLTLAEVLAPLSFEATVRFVFFTGEEQGKRGSSAYVADVYAAHEVIAGVYNLDMIAWDSTGEPDFDIHTLSTTTPNDSQALADLLVHVIGLYALPLKPQIYRSGTDFSDHYSFWRYGYPAVFVIEDWYNASGGPYAPRDWNPNYHTKNDRLSTLNLDYAQAIARAAMAAFLHLARPLRTLQGQVRAPDGTPLAATLYLSGSGVTTQTVTTDGRYRLILPAATYSLTISAPYYETFTQSVNLNDLSPKTLDITLTPWPSYRLTGSLSDAVNTLPLSGTLSVDGGAPQPVAARFSLTLRRGEHTLTVRVPYHYPQTRAINLTAAQELTFALTPTPCLLLVDDDDGNSAEQAYLQALNALGYPYGLWTVAHGSAGPDAATLALYHGVIWVTGSAAAPLQTPDLTALRTYLEGGGRLLLSGARVTTGAWDEALFHTRALGSEEETSIVMGDAFLSPITLTMEAPTVVEKIAPREGAMSIAHYPSGADAATAYKDAHGGSVVVGFELEHARDTATRDTALALMVNYLAPCPPYAMEIAAPDVAFGKPAVPIVQPLTVVNRGYRTDRYSATLTSAPWPVHLSATQSPDLSEHEAWHPLLQATLPLTSTPGSSAQVTITLHSHLAPELVQTRTLRIVHAWQLYLPTIIR